LALLEVFGSVMTQWGRRRRRRRILRSMGFWHADTAMLRVRRKRNTFSHCKSGAANPANSACSIEGNLKYSALFFSCHG